MIHNDRTGELCPVCNHEPIYLVRNDDGTWHCYTCGWDFTPEWEKLDFSDLDNDEPDGLPIDAWG